MSTNRNSVSGLSKDALFDILNDIDTERELDRRELDRTNIPDHQNEKGHKSKTSKSW